MKIFVTGGTGFVGTAITKRLLTDGHKLTVLRHKRKVRPVDENLNFVQGSIMYPEGWAHLLCDVDAVVHLVGIIREYPLRNITFERLHVQATKNIVDASVKAGVKRYLHMSANGAGSRGDTKYLVTKTKAEEIVKNSGLKYAIFRPSMIYGAGDALTIMLAKNLKRFPIFPCFGRGDFMLQPVHVEDVARVFSSSLKHAELIGRAFQVGGPAPVIWLQMLHNICDILSVRRKIISLPIPLVQTVVKTLGKLSFFPVTEDMLTMLLRGNVTPDNQIFDHLGFAPSDMVETMRKYLLQPYCLDRMTP